MEMHQGNTIWEYETKKLYGKLFFPFFTKKLVSKSVEFGEVNGESLEANLLQYNQAHDQLIFMCHVFFPFNFFSRHIPWTKTAKHERLSFVYIKKTDDLRNMDNFYMWQRQSVLLGYCRFVNAKLYCSHLLSVDTEFTNWETLNANEVQKKCNK